MFSQLLKFIFLIVTFLSVGEVLGATARERDLSGSSNRVQMRIYRGPSNGEHTQFGYFIRQPSFD